VTVETPQASTLSQTGNDADGPPIAWPDPLPSGAAAQAENPIADPINIAVDPGSIDASYPTANAENSIATIVAFLAFGLAALGFAAKRVAARRAPRIIDHREPDDQRRREWRGGQGRRGSVDEGQLLVSALSDLRPFRNDDVSFETAFELRKRKDELARLHQNLDRLLQSPTTA